MDWFGFKTDWSDYWSGYEMYVFVEVSYLSSDVGGKGGKLPI